MRIFKLLIFGVRIVIALQSALKIIACVRSVVYLMVKFFEKVSTIKLLTIGFACYNPMH